MKKMICTLLILLMCIPLVAIAMAAEIGVEVDAPGYLACVLPEAPEIALGEEHGEYIVRWEPLDGIFMYQINVIKYAKILDRNSMAIAPAVGYVSGEKISDGAGVAYDIPLSITGCLEVDGSSTQVDIAPLLNALRPDHALIETAKCYLVVTVIPNTGKPVVQLFELPMR